MKYLVLAACAALALPGANAQSVESVRLGVMNHNIRVTDGKNADKESGVNVDGELRFSSPALLKAIGSPRPFVMASLNSDGNTSYAAAGLQWDIPLSSRWRVESGFGYAIHDGAVNNPYPSGTQAAVDFSRDHVLLGSRDLFRSSLALTLDLGGPWAVQGLYEHLSHGQILGSGRNQGLDEIGVRAIYRFGG
jgi:lipid A 3-O-deacylase